MSTALLGVAAPCCFFQRGPAVLLSSSTLTYQRCSLYGVSRLGNPSVSPWRGLKRVGFTFQGIYTRSGRKGKSKRMAVYSSLFGVGAPEILVIGVVALLVFGPKGLAEVAQNLGRTVRSFQPTIRELQEVSREFKNTFEREIGLDEIPSPAKSSYVTDILAQKSQQEISGPNGKPTAEPSTEPTEVVEAQLATTTSSQAESDEEESQATTAAAAAAASSVSSPSEETASAAHETSATTRSSATREDDEGAT